MRILLLHNALAICTTATSLPDGLGRRLQSRRRSAGDLETGSGPGEPGGPIDSVDLVTTNMLIVAVH